ncbi:MULTISPECIES: STAS domain-containing protein [unclassified Streptomyces]|uniref:STAS domain-containing protein n=1 Tax=unclassified Streptomyces TaxID=2593676 RepID=UPI0005ECBFD7|nr:MULTISPECIES: STAS domain-containing protein [unclassified Streptomyces]APU38569.1 anti-anti-sigma factor [Streptomyces sp. TN58]KJK45537.1 anti-sigma factor antagonist [Streptomyces sp. NRRL F-4428]
MGEEAVVTTTTTRDATVIRLRGEVDEDSAPSLVGALARAAACGLPRTVVDLSGTPFVDSSVLHALLDAQRAHADAGSVLVLAGPLHTAVRRLFEVTGTAAAFRTADSLATAMTC